MGKADDKTWSIVDSHRQAYDVVAAEYEEKVESRRPETTLVADMIQRYVSDGLLLDIGCGVGLLVQILRDRGAECYGIDISSEMVSFARKRTNDAVIIHADFVTHEFTKKYHGISALAFIHLFPLNIARLVLEKIHRLLVPNGILYIGTTKGGSPSEGTAVKWDYRGEVVRFRKQWTIDEFRIFLVEGGFEIMEILEIPDSHGKIWMDFIVRRSKVDRSI